MVLNCSIGISFCIMICQWNNYDFMTKKYFAKSVLPMEYVVTYRANGINHCMPMDFSIGKTSVISRGLKS